MCSTQFKRAQFVLPCYYNLVFVLFPWNKEAKIYSNFLFLCTQIYDFVSDLAAVPPNCPLCHRFGLSATDLAAVSQFWRLCHRFGHLATDLATMPQIWLRATDLVSMSQIWQLCFRFGCRATDLAAMSQI